MDKELIEATKKLKNKGNGNDFLEEHKFIANCLQIGFRIEDLKQMDYKDVAKFRRYLTERAKILPRRISGCCAKHQRQLTVAIKRARYIALLPYSSD